MTPAPTLRARRAGPRVSAVADGPWIEGLPSAKLVAIAVGPGDDAAHAWRVLVERHAGTVWRVVRCFGLPSEASWDAYQRTWLRAIEQLGTLREPERFAAWLSMIARRQAIDVIRGRRRAVPVESLDDRPAPEPPAGDRLQRQELRDAVREGMTHLSRSCQDLLRLLSTDPPLPYEEICQLLDMPHGSIGPTRRRCLEKLRATPPMARYLGDA